ncbi:MAG: hypothetical protein FJ125_05765 [Deltaproteobacteria bacterium]|nr:hypothetical protein [Deltaproteobacteria bacterium]
MAEVKSQCSPFLHRSRAACAPGAGVLAPSIALPITLVAPLFTLLAGGCSSSDQDRLQRDIATLKEDIHELGRSDREEGRRIAQLSGAVRQLEDRLGDGGGSAAAGSPFLPPEAAALPIIRLRPDGQSGGSYTVLGRPAGQQAPHPAAGAQRPGPWRNSPMAPGEPGDQAGAGPLSGRAPVLEALQRLAFGNRERPLTVVHYGDSHSKASALADELRRGLSRSGRISPGYVTREHPMLWEAKVSSSPGWTRQNWLATRDTGSFGPLGIAYLTRKAGTTLTLELTGAVPLTGIEVTAFYHRTPGHLPFQLASSGRTLARVKPPPRSAGAVPPLGATMVTLPSGARTLELTVLKGAQRGGQELRVFGFATRYPGADVEWDVLAVGGTTINHPLLRSDETLPLYLSQRRPDLLVVWFGTNSLLEPDLDLERYRQRFTELLERFQAAAPQAQCLVVGPPDLLGREISCFLDREQRRIVERKLRGRKAEAMLAHGRPARRCNPDDLLRRQGKKVVYPVPEVRTAEEWERYKQGCTYHTVPQLAGMITAQQQAAYARGCAYFDTFLFMGGNESMQRWACAEEPRLALLDLVHLSQRGYRKVAQGILEALRGMQLEGWQGG